MPAATRVHVGRTQISQPLLDQFARLSDRARDVVVPVSHMSQYAVAGIEQLVEAVCFVVLVQLADVHRINLPRLRRRETELFATTGEILTGRGQESTVLRSLCRPSLQWNSSDIGRTTIATLVSVT